MNPTAFRPALASSISDVNGLWKLGKECSRNTNAQKRYLDCVRVYPQIIEHDMFSLIFLFGPYQACRVT